MNINNLSKSSKKKLSIFLVALVIVLLGCVLSHRYLWLFSPAYSQRNVTRQFFNDVSKNDTVDAYKLTSNSYQSASTYSYFLSQIGKTSGDKTSVTFVAYASSKSVVAVTGYINDKTISQKLSFAINFVGSPKGPRIDSIIITPAQ